MWNEKFWLEQLTYKPAALEIELQNKTCNLNAKGFTQKKSWYMYKPISNNNTNSVVQIIFFLKILEIVEYYRGLDKNKCK